MERHRIRHPKQAGKNPDTRFIGESHATVWLSVIHSSLANTSDCSKSLPVLYSSGDLELHRSKGLTIT